GRNWSAPWRGGTCRCRLCANAFLRPVLDEASDLHRHAFARLHDGGPNGRLERELVGGAVALQHDTVEAHEARAVVAARVEPRPNGVQGAVGDQALQVAQQVAVELLFEERG